jgi:hypothetical protein
MYVIIGSHFCDACNRSTYTSGEGRMNILVPYIFYTRFSFFDIECFSLTNMNCAPLLADLFLYSYEPDFIQVLPKKNEKMLTDPLISRSVI